MAVVDVDAAGDVARTKILLLGLRRSGKSSIIQVLFNDLTPKQTFYLDSTLRINKLAYDTVIPLEIWDCPGNVTVDSLRPLSQFRTIIFVIDIRDLYNQAITKLVDFVIAAYSENPQLHFEVFVHKVEKLQDDDKVENFRQINERVLDRLLEISSDYEQLPLAFQMTSVYDHSLHLAFSKVLLKLVGLLPYLEGLLNVFCANSQSPKAFLFDIKSRLYVATDASPVDTMTHELCCDYLQMLNSFGPLYRSTSASNVRHQMIEPRREAESSEEGDGYSGVVRRPLFYPSGAALLHSTNPGTTLTYHLITEHLALLALIPTSVYESRRGMVEYNVVFFREGVQAIYEVERQVRGGG